jgi:hypothetical protein
MTLSPVNNRLRMTAGNAGLSGSRTDVHKVVVTMAAGHQTYVDRGSGKPTQRRIVPRVDALVGRLGTRRNGVLGGAAPDDGSALGVAGSFNNLLSTRMLQQESGAENRALYEQDRQRQLELQRRALDVRVLVGP